MQGVPHHLLSLFDPKERVNVTDFIGMAEQVGLLRWRSHSIVCHVKYENHCILIDFID